MDQKAELEDDGLPPIDFDPSQIFIGREQQLNFFEIYLSRWKRVMVISTPNADFQRATPSPNNKIQGLVVLLYGRGGFGKSTLLRRYRDIALRENQSPLSSRILVSDVIDWEFAAEGKRSLFNVQVESELNVTEYFQALSSQLAYALGKKPKDFKMYQSTLWDVERARKMANDVLDNMQKDDRYDWLRALTVEGLSAMIRTLIPGANFLLDHSVVKTTADEVVKITQEQMLQFRAKLADKMGSKLGDFLEPGLVLGLSLGRDLYEFARNYPLLIFFDTYEEIAIADQLLRVVMGAAGLRVGWVMAGRDNLWGGSEQRKRNIAKEYGYKDIVLSDRGLAVDFNVGGVGAFTISDIAEYFSLLCKHVRYEPPLPPITEEGASAILEVTTGVPLAVKIAAGLYVETANLELVTEKASSKRKIVDQMVERYLLHAHDDQRERSKLYGLAMLRRADHPPAIAAALGLSPEGMATQYASELSRLHRRYSFIYTEKEHPSLHQEVRHFLRLWLLERCSEPEVLATNQRLTKIHEYSLLVLEEQRRYISLRDRLEDEQWCNFYLDSIEQQFWLDPVEGVKFALPFMMAAAIYRREMNREVVEIGKFFETSIPQPYRKRWECAIQGLINAASRNLSPETIPQLEELRQVVSQSRFPSLWEYRESELEALLCWRLGEVYSGKDDHKALECYEMALSRLSQEEELREAAAKVYWEIGSKLYEEQMYTGCIGAFSRALELKPDLTIAYYKRGAAYLVLKEYRQAINDFDRVLEIDPRHADAQENRNSAYSALEQDQQASINIAHVPIEEERTANRNPDDVLPQAPEKDEPAADSHHQYNGGGQPKPPRKLRVFLCHSSGDKPAVRNLYQRLRDAGIDPWLDEENLLPGQNWQQEIRKAVRTADIVIVCLSSSSINKTGFVQKEIRDVLDMADEQPEGTIFLIPLKLEECQVPERLRRWQWVNFFEEQGYERLMRALKTRFTSSL